MLNRPDFSILIPSRDRPDKLRNLLSSIIKTSLNIDKIEIIVTIDSDEPQIEKYHAIERSMMLHKFMMVKRPRTEVFPDYYNAMAFVSCGRILWVLNDDCIIKTYGWDFSVLDALAKNEISSVWYGDVGDTTRNYNNNGQYSCFPMMSREAYEALGYFFNPKIIAWGTDKFLKYVFEKSNSAIVDLTSLTVEHVHLQDDETHTVLINRLKSNAGQESMVDYGPDIERLRQAGQALHKE